MAIHTLPRRAEARVTEALADTRIVLINGPRQSGKTTLAREVLRGRSGRYLTLDDPATLRTVLEDPREIVRGPGLTVIDEFQRGGDALVRCLKIEVDEDPRPGRFLLTGSSRFLVVPSLSESLAGRVEIVDLWPLSQGEILGRKETFLDRLMDGPARLRSLRPESGTRAALFDRVCRGGLPEAVLRAPRRRKALFASYARTLLSRDARDILRVREARDLRRLLHLLAARTAQVVNQSALSADLGVPRTTVSTHLSLLGMIYVHFELPAWSRNLSSKAVRSPKLHLTDTGLAAHLLGLGAEAAGRPGSRVAGPLLETFAVSEILRQASWSEDPPEAGHFRDAAGREIDLVLESAQGRIAAVEVKATSSPGERDFRSLEWLRDRTGADFIQGVLLCTAREPMPAGDRLTLLPVSSLWEG
ncbi:MAG: ATP-binding protein [Planctomycetes bacterium]|nr:ATP-binding protein [Planctomycetota bacterium]